MGGTGDDVLLGGSGDSVMDGGGDDDLLVGSGGKDVLFGDTGRDVLNGGDYHDLLDGGTGADTLNGEWGNDTLIGSGDFQADVLDGGKGDDLLDLGGLDAATGGVGADSFSVTGDLDDLVTITDFDEGEDLLAADYTANPSGAPTVDDIFSSQMVTAEGATVQIGDTTVLLEGLTAAISKDAIVVLV